MALSHEEQARIDLAATFRIIAHLGMHEAVANLGYALIGLHAVAALYHHYMRHDNTLLRMSLKG